GSFTGEVSVPMLPQFGVKFVIVGHSERRNMGETDAMVNRKVRAVVTEKMSVIICVGESGRDSHGEYLDFVRKQLMEALHDVSKKNLSQIVIAYEPVWAIGAKEAMHPREIHEMTIFIKKVLHELYGKESDGVRILYGGDVTADDVTEIIQNGFVNGVLVG